MGHPLTPAAVRGHDGTRSWQDRAAPWLLVVGVAASLPRLVGTLLTRSASILDVDFDALVPLLGVLRALWHVGAVALLVALVVLRIVDEHEPGTGRLRWIAVLTGATEVGMRALTAVLPFSFVAFAVLAVVGLVQDLAIARWLQAILIARGRSSGLWIVVAVDGAVGILAALGGSDVLFVVQAVGSMVVAAWILIEVLRGRRALLG